MSAVTRKFYWLGHDRKSAGDTGDSIVLDILEGEVAFIARAARAAGTGEITITIEHRTPAKDETAASEWTALPAMTSADGVLSGAQLAPVDQIGGAVAALFDVA